MAELTNVYATEQNTVQTVTGTSWGSNHSPSSNAYACQIPAASMSASTKYLVVARALVGSDSTNLHVFAEVRYSDDSLSSHGGIDLTARYEMEQTGDNTELKTMMLVGSFTTPSGHTTGDDLELGIYVEGSNGYIDQASLWILDLDAIGSEGTDYHEDLRTTDSGEFSLSADTTVIGQLASGDLGTDEWLILGTAITNGSGMAGRWFKLCVHTAPNSATNSEVLSTLEDGEDKDERRPFGFGIIHHDTSTASDVTMYGQEEANQNNQVCTDAYLIALPTSLFADVEWDYDAGSVVANGETTIQTVPASGTYTPSVTGNHLVIGHAVDESGAGANAYLWVEEGTTEIRTGDSAPTQDQNWATSDEEWLATFQQYSITGSSLTYNLQADVGANTIRDRWLVLVNLNEPAAGDIDLIAAVAASSSVAADVGGFVTKHLASTPTGTATVAAGLIQIHELGQYRPALGFDDPTLVVASSAVTAALSNVAINELASDVAGASTVTAQLSQIHEFTAAVAASSTVTAALFEIEQLQAQVAATSTVTAVLTNQALNELAATVTGTSTVPAPHLFRDPIDLSASVAATAYNPMAFPVLFGATYLTQIHNMTATVAASSAVTAAGWNTELSATVTGQSSVTADLFEIEQLAATVAGVSTVAAQLVQIHRLAASVTASSTVAAVLDRTAALVASPAGSSTVAAGLVQIHNLTAAVAATSAVTAVVAGNTLLVSTVTATSTVAAQLSQIHQLAAAVTATSTVAAGNIVTVELSAAVAGTSTVTAQLVQTHELQASVTATSTVTADIFGVTLLSSTSAGQATVAAQLHQTHRLAASVVASSTVTASLLEIEQLAAAVAASSTVTADLEVATELAATVTGSSSVSAVLTNEAGIDLAADVAASTTVTADLTVVTELAAAVAGLSSVSAVLTTQPTIELAATAAGQASVTATLLEIEQLAATVSASSSVTAALTQTNDTTAAVAGLSTVSAQLTQLHRLEASVVGQSTAAGQLEIITHLIVAAAAQSTVTAALTQTNSLTAVVAAQAAATGLLYQLHQLSATVPATSTVVALMQVVFPATKGYVTLAQHLTASAVTMDEKISTVTPDEYLVGAATTGDY